MASPWTPAQRPPVERPWMGMALLAAIPLLSLVLIRMLWSGSSLWFLMVGIILIGAAAVIFLARRPQEMEFDRRALTAETTRTPLILAGLGVFFLAMLLLPNFVGGDSDTEGTAQQQAPAASDVLADAEQPAVQQPPAEAPAEPSGQEAPPAGGETYVVQSGDNLWDIAQRYGTTVEAIAEANDLANPADLYVGQELIIPAVEAASGVAQ